jgi:hypothetical protein
MDESENQNVVVGRVARAELCQCQNSVVLTLGALSLRLDFEAAHDIAMTLRQVLMSLEPAPALSAVVGDASN